MEPENLIQAMNYEMWFGRERVAGPSSLFPSRCGYLYSRGKCFALGGVLAALQLSKLKAEQNQNHSISVQIKSTLMPFLSSLSFGLSFFCLSCLSQLFSHVVNLQQVDELKVELKRRGWSTSGLKAELSQRLSECLMRFSLRDDNFRQAEVVDTTSTTADLPSCFPEASD